MKPNYNYCKRKKYNQIIIFEVQTRIYVDSLTDVKIVEHTFEMRISLTCDWKAGKDEVLTICQGKSATVNPGLLEYIPSIEPVALEILNGKKSTYYSMIEGDMRKGLELT